MGLGYKSLDGLGQREGCGAKGVGWMAVLDHLALGWARSSLWCCGGLPWNGCWSRRIETECVSIVELMPQVKQNAGKKRALAQMDSTDCVNGVRCR